MLALFAFLFFITSDVSAQGSDRLDNFIDSLGNFAEGFDLSTQKSSYDNRDPAHYDPYDSLYYNYNYNSRLLDTYLNIRLIESIFPSDSRHTIHSGYIYIRPSLDPVLKYPLIAIPSITLSMMIIFLILDFIKRRPVRGRRLYNTFIIGVIGIISYIGLYLACHVIKLVVMFLMVSFPHFYPYFLGTVGFLLLSFSVIVGYKRVQYRNRRSTNMFTRNEHLV